MDTRKTTFPRPLKVKGKYRTFCAGFPGCTVVKNLPAMQETQEMWDVIPRSERSPEGGDDNPFQYYCLENPMDRGA